MNYEIGSHSSDFAFFIPVSVSQLCGSKMLFPVELISTFSCSLHLPFFSFTSSTVHAQALLLLDLGLEYWIRFCPVRPTGSIASMRRAAFVAFVRSRPRLSYQGAPECFSVWRMSAFSVLMNSFFRQHGIDPGSEGRCLSCLGRRLNRNSNFHPSIIA